MLILQQNNQLKLRERLLVEKCLQTIIIDFETKINDTCCNNYDDIAIIDLKLDFLSFITSNEKEEVEYGINFLMNNKCKFWHAIKHLTPLILEYQTFGLNGSLHCCPINLCKEDCEQEISNKPSLWQKLKFWRKHV